MSMALQSRMSALEQTVRSQADEIEALHRTVAQLIETASQKTLTLNSSPMKPRTMCPHCGLVPNYFLHTRSCKGKVA